jgi:hypothetical protein
MSFTEYENAVRAECISLMGCAETDDSLTQVGDTVFHCLVSCHFGTGPVVHPVEPSKVAREWQAIVQKAPKDLKGDTGPQLREPPINRLQAYYRR